MPGQRPFGGLAISALPFLYASLEHFIGQSTGVDKSKRPHLLSDNDAIELAEEVCGPLLTALSPFHDLELAIMEVEKLIETVNCLSLVGFLLLLAYLEINEQEAASKFAKRIIESYKLNSYRDFYREFVKNVERHYATSLLGLQSSVLPSCGVTEARAFPRHTSWFVYAFLSQNPSGLAKSMFY